MRLASGWCSQTPRCGQYARDRKGVVAETSKYMGFLAPIPEFLQPCGTAAFGIGISAFQSPRPKLSGTTSGPKSSPWLRGQNLYGAQNWQAWARKPLQTCS